MTQAGGGGICMQLQIYMIWSACSKDMIFHPKSKYFQVRKWIYIVYSI
jgi:hypothetical protein